METQIYISLALSAVAALFSILIFLQRRSNTGVSEQRLSELLRSETDRQRSAIEEQARLTRQENSDGFQRFQDATFTAFRELGEALSMRIADFGSRLDIGVKAIDERVSGIGTKLDQDIKKMGEDAAVGREVLRTLIEEKLDASTEKQITAARQLREEIGNSVASLQEALLKSASDQRISQDQLFTNFARNLSENLVTMNTRSEEMKALLSQSLLDLATGTEGRHQNLLSLLDTKLKDLAEANLNTAAKMREEISTSFVTLGTATRETMAAMSEQQRERLELVAKTISDLTVKQSQDQETLRQTVEGRLDTLRTENTKKLDEIRQTVDEQLQKTLQERITGSFKLVQDQLEQVYRGLGEMQKLADGVGDLKKVLSNVKTRGVFGEVQLGSILEQMFSSEQYVENAQVKDGSQERVEFAIKIPGRSGEGEVLLPIDAKFPIEDYERIVDAAERADAPALELLTAQLEARIRNFAKDIGDKYVNPPRTTDIAILFLPVEGLYAEVLRRPGLIQSIQEKHHVTIAGPNNLMAILNAFRMAIRAVAIQKRSTEVWQVLGAVRTEFDKHGTVVARLEKQLEASLNTVSNLHTRTRAMKRRLQGVDSIGTEKIEEVLGLEALAPEDDTDSAADQST